MPETRTIVITARSRYDGIAVLFRFALTLGNLKERLDAGAKSIQSARASRIISFESVVSLPDLE